MSKKNGGVNSSLLFSPPPSLQQVDHDEESPRSQAVSETNWSDEPPVSPQGSDMATPVRNKLFWSKLKSPSTQHVTPMSLDTDTRRDCSSKLTTIWDTVTSKGRILIFLLTFCVLWPLGAISFKQFTHATDSTFHPVPNSLSAQAQQAFTDSYKNDWSDPMHPVLIVALESKNQSLVNKTSPAYAVARNFSMGLASALETACWEGQPCPSTEKWTRVSSYYSFEDIKLTFLAKSLATADGLTSLIQVQYILPANETNPRARVAELQQKIRDYGSLHSSPEFKVSYTGLKFFQSDLMESTQSDLRHMDAIVLPLALFLVGMVLPRARTGVVWVIPLITMISTVCAWSIVMRFVASKRQITQFTPSVMMSLTLGMGIDYTLFLLSRYLELNKSNKIHNMIQNGGHVILTSGITLMCTFLGLCFLPLQMLKSVGIGASVAIGCALFVNLTIVPALLHTRLGQWVIQPEETPEEQEEDAQDPLEENLLDSPSSHHSDDDQEESAVPVTSLWYRLSFHLLHPQRSAMILAGIVLLLLPVAWHGTQVRSSISFDLLLPSASPSLQTFHSLGLKLGWGRLSPYRIMFDGRDAKLDMTSDKGFDLMHRVIDEMIAIDSNGEEIGITHVGTADDESEDLVHELAHVVGTKHQIHVNTNPFGDVSHVPNDPNAELIMCDDNSLMTSNGTRRTEYGGIAVVRNSRIPHSLYTAAKVCSRIPPYCPVESLHLIDYIDHAVTTSKGHVTYVTATLGVNPFSDEGVAWLVKARETLDRLEHGGALGGVKIYIQGGAGIAHDAVEAVYAAFPTVIARTMIVVFLLMGFFFRSVVTPLRSIVSIGFTLCFVFGLGVLVYQHGILNWTEVHSWSTLEPNEICWVTPVMAFSIIVGLALDYDVFLISRILEYRTEGYDHKSSIAAGLHATGSIITAAGVIMAVAFGGLMLSSSPALYQWSFLLTVAVLLDTFVIRTLVVPIIVGYTGKFSWWPRQLPTETIRIFPEDLVETRGNTGELPAEHLVLMRGGLETPQRTVQAGQQSVESP